MSLGEQNYLTKNLFQSDHQHERHQDFATNAEMLVDYSLERGRLHTFPQCSARAPFFFIVRLQEIFNGHTAEHAQVELELMYTEHRNTGRKK